MQMDGRTDMTKLTVSFRNFANAPTMVCLTLRLLMSYICVCVCVEHQFLMFLDHTQRRTTVGRTPLDE